MKGSVNIDNLAWESYYKSILKDAKFESYRYQDKKHPYMKRILRYSQGKKRSLEFGSGQGGLSLALKREYPEIEAHLLDFSQPSIEFSKDLFRYYGVDGNFYRGNLLELPYPDGHFDFIHGNTVLEHVEDAEKAVGELTRVLAKGGIGVITVPNSHRRFDGHDLYHFINDIKYYSRTFYPKELEDLFKKRSCDILDRFGFGAVYFYPSYPLQYLCRLMEKLFTNNKCIVNIEQHGEFDNPAAATGGDRKISDLRKIMRIWGNAQGKFNLFMEHHEILPYPCWIIVGVVIKKE